MLRHPPHSIHGNQYDFVNMAMLYNTAMLYSSSEVRSSHMSSSASYPRHDAAVANLEARFRAHGWQVDPAAGERAFGPDMVISKGNWRYAVELKALKEGRSDRVLALLAQAILQARRHADQADAAPLAVVQVARASMSLQRKVEQFHRDYASNTAMALVAEDGGAWFVGPGLDELDDPVLPGHERGKLVRPRKAADLFSDLNQWLLKVLLAPELPVHLLNAPRANYRNGSALAEAASVSVMSVSRFVRRMREEGFLESRAEDLRVVRRGELFRRWRSAASRSSPELRMAYLIPAPGSHQLQKAAVGLDACIGVFAAADLLKLGHVSGVPPHLYVRHLVPPSPDVGWSGLVPVSPGEPARVILKQPPAPESLFRAAVRVDNVLVSDVLQVWLDASAQPSRGAEQADFLRHGVLANVLGEPN